ncbi:hydroxyacid dehydrogenase [Cerasicoccus frondis]|uniref:hydroxyacid dehydrogenase n=1 Tax=Cerasicoccus frondis TaxID=490090 RepID=UPI00285260CB|nr:hydroxyacid dehydrogenase [Cerasicoccus frondis]
MESDSASIEPRSLAAALDPEHVLFVMTPEERQLFLPDCDDRFAADARKTWVNAKVMSAREWAETLRELRPTVLVTAWSCPKIPVSWALADDCPLKYVCSVTGSVKPRIPRVVLEKGVLVSNWGNIISYTIAEHALLMVLSCLRNVGHWPALIAEPQPMFAMMPRMKTRSLRGKRVGLHGFGAIARELASMLKPHQVRLSSWSQGVPSALFAEHGVRRSESLAELFATSDILIECEGLNDLSRGSVTESLLRTMPAEAVFVNIARGHLVEDESALAALASEGRIRVALDVFHTAHLAAHSPLRTSENILLSPHVAGPTWDTYPLLGEQAMTNIEKYLNGETPDNVVTLEIYDRST